MRPGNTLEEIESNLKAKRLREERENLLFIERVKSDSRFMFENYLGVDYVCG